MNSRNVILVASILLVGVTGATSAQERRLHAGDRVRVTLSTPRGQRLEEGELRELSDRTLVMRDPSGQEREIPTVALTRLEVRSGGSTKAGWGALFGGVLGLTLGLAIGSSQTPDPCNDELFCFSGDQARAFSAGWHGILGMFAGAALGGFVGSSIKEDATWEPVPIGRLHVGRLPPSDHRIALIASRSF